MCYKGCKLGSDQNVMKGSLLVEESLFSAASGLLFDRIFKRHAGILHTWPTDALNTLRTGSFKLFKRPLPGFLTILTL